MAETVRGKMQIVSASRSPIHRDGLGVHEQPWAVWEGIGLDAMWGTVSSFTVQCQARWRWRAVFWTGAARKQRAQ